MRVRKLVGPIAALCFVAALMASPQTAIWAARQSLYDWQRSVAPALLPFLTALPALTSPEACGVYNRVFARAARALGLSGALTGALACGLLAGSPAGAIATRDVCARGGVRLAEARRCAILSSGASPAFLICSLAGGMLEAPELGWLLLRSQLLATAGVGAALRLMWRGDMREATAEAINQSESAAWRAVKSVLNIAAYMVLFSVLARQLATFIDPASESAFLCALEFAGACARIAASELPLQRALPLMSAVACFGGASVCAQCMVYLRPLGIGLVDYLPWKAAQALLAAALTSAQLAAGFGGARAPLLRGGALAASALGAGALLALLLLSMAIVPPQTAVARGKRQF